MTGSGTTGTFSSAPSEHTGAAKPIATTSQTETSSGNPSDSSSQTAASATPANSNPPTSRQLVPITPGNPAPQASAVQPAVDLGFPRQAEDSASSSSAQAPAPPSAPLELPANPGPGPVQMAQMVNKAAQSEMRIELNTSAFGNVEVHTVVHANEVGVLIGSEKGDLRTLLSNELPAIANILQQQNLRLNPVNFLQGFAFSNQSSGGDSQQRSFARTGGQQSSSRDASDRESSSPAEVLTVRYSSGNLSILA